MATSSKHHGLGRGLDALIRGGGTAAGASAKAVPAAPAKRGASAPAKAPAKGAGKAAPAAKAAPEAEEAAGRGVRMVAVGKIVRSPWQPRRVFAQEALDELAASVGERGVLQPLLVRRLADGQYELIAGERRFRAAQLAGLAEVPVLVQEASDREALELALVENIQREDLNLIEEAQGYQTLAQTFSLTQEQVAQRVGKARATVANCLRLLELPDTIKRALAERTISAGHAKVLLGVEPERRELLAARVVAQGLSVRALEQLAKAAPHVPAKRNPPAATSATVSNERQARQLRHLAERMQQELGTKVTLTAPRTRADGRKETGTLTIEYYDDEDLSRLLEALNLGDLG